MTLNKLKTHVGTFKHVVAGHGEIYTFPASNQLSWRLSGTEDGKV